MTIFFFLPAILLSGFAFPFEGMPVWARWIGEVLPATHFLRVVRGILLKGNGLAEIWPELWPLFSLCSWSRASQSPASGVRWISQGDWDGNPRLLPTCIRK